MGAVHSKRTKLTKSPKRNSFRRRLSCSAPRGNFQTKTKVIVFSQCITDFALQCAVGLLQASGSLARVHATTDDYDNVKRLGDKIILKYLNKGLFLHKVDLNKEESIAEALSEILNMEGSIDVLGMLLFTPCLRHVYAVLRVAIASISITNINNNWGSGVIYS